MRSSTARAAGPGASASGPTLGAGCLDPPPAPALKEARSLLEAIRALDSGGRITADGRALQALPLPPRLARMVVAAARFGQAGLG
ncbi:MAG: hypothetical protein J0J00_06190, partial [Microbacterium sp.]|nr:hypothetical protein [Microbacterium sp.]